MAVYGGVARELKKRWIWIVAVVIALLIGVSRFIVGVHYPTDVLGGWVIGVFAILFSILMEKVVKQEWLRYVILLVISLPGILWCSSRDYYSSLGMLDTRNPFAMILRVAGAFAIYLVLNKVLKMPFSTEWLDSGKLVPNLVRTARYAIILFIVIGVYPKVFPVFEKIRFGKK